MNVRFIYTLLVLLLFFACSESEESTFYSADFDWKVDENNPNRVIFENLSDGEYLYFEWDYGNGTKSGVQKDKLYKGTAFYALKGDYDVTLTVWGSSNTANDTKVLTKKISIAQDDSNYITPEPEEGLIWSDEFNETIDANVWSFETGSNGWGNQELQNYTNGNNAHIENGKLVITARKVDENKAAGSYTSTRMITLGKKEFTYGRIEIRAKLPSGKGVWPAIWMLGSNINQVGWPACGEIDIMEYVGYQPNYIHGSIHCPASYGATEFTKKLELENCEEEFNSYGIIWSENSIAYYVNNPETPFYTYTPKALDNSHWPFNKPCFIILNLAVGGTWGGAQGVDNSIFPQTMEIDYVRVYKIK